VHRKFTVEELNDASPNNGGGQTIVSSADLTLGGYCQLLQRRERWDRLNLTVDRAVFTERLDAVRRIRNDVMHFDPDGLAPAETKMLEDLAKFFRDLVRMHAI
jgi:hypothetical protein